MLFSTHAFSQAPQAFNYQGIARDSAGIPLADQEIKIRISITDNPTLEDIEFQELQTVVTNDLGVFGLRIGQGTPLNGIFSNIDWSTGSFYVKTEIQLSDSQSFIEAGNSQLYSVPYALYANSSGNNQDSDPDPTNELQTLSLDNNVLSISGANSITLPNTTSSNETVSNIWKSENSNAIYDQGGNIVYRENDATLFSISADENGGMWSANDPSGNQRVEAQILDSGSGFIETSGPNGNDNVSITNRSSNPNHGSISIKDENGDTRSSNFINSSGAGRISLSGPNGEDNITLSHLSSNPNQGFISLKGENGNSNSGIYIDSDDSGSIFLDGPNSYNIFMSGFSDNPDQPYLALYDDFNETKIFALINANNAGRISTYGPNNNSNVYLGNLNSNANHGYISVIDSEGEDRAGIYIDQNGLGRVFADFVDNFEVNPDKANEPIIYTMIQGPEAAAYLRGTGTMVNGTAQISFPSHFSNLISADNITVLLTPLSAKSKGMAVVKKGVDGFLVQELLEGQGNYSFDWEVKGLRKRQYKNSGTELYKNLHHHKTVDREDKPRPKIEDNNDN